MNKTVIRIKRSELTQFCREVCIAMGMPSREAQDCAEVLVAADARGIARHVIARLQRYVNGLKTGVMKPGVEPELLRRTPVSAVYDARGGIGLSLSRQVMRQVIEGARDKGFFTAAVKDSNHFGIAGYYAMMALEEDMIGIALTNTAALGVPTFGREALFGTNPIAAAVPAGSMPPFVLDMATTVVTRGKIESYERRGEQIPSGWAVDTRGIVSNSPAELLQDMLHQAGGGILPLGGEGELKGGHKGFGLGVLVDILTGIASGGTFGKDVRDSEETSARVSHFFAAVRIDLFQEPGAFKQAMDRLLGSIAKAEPAEGQERVWYAGLKEYEHEAFCAVHGVPAAVEVWRNLEKISLETGVSLPQTVSGSD